MSTSKQALAAVGAAVLAASGDDDHGVGAAAGPFLVAGLGDPNVEMVLRALVDDARDTAVSRQVARALVADGGDAGLRLVLSCLGSMDTADTSAHWVLEGISDAWHDHRDTGAGARNEALGRLVEDGDPQVATGARWARQELERSRADPWVPGRRRRWWCWW